MKKPAIRPRGYTTVTASLAVTNVSEALEFLKTALNAEVQITDNEENPAFASAKIGNAMVFVTNGWAAHGHVPHAQGQTSSVSLHLYVEDVVASTEQAVAAGATLVSEPQDMFWGERTAAITDPFGHCWTLAERVEVLTAKEIAARLAPVQEEEQLVDEPAEA